MSTPIEARIKMRAQLRELLDDSEIIDPFLTVQQRANAIDRLSEAAIEIVVREVRELAATLYDARRGGSRDG